MSTEASRSEPSAPDYYQIAFENLNPLPRVLPGPWPIDENKLRIAEKRCRELRRWIGATEMPAPLRREYEGWLDFCEKDNLRSRHELETGDLARAHEKAWAKVTAKIEAARDNTFPKPPDIAEGQS